MSRLQQQGSQEEFYQPEQRPEETSLPTVETPLDQLIQQGVSSADPNLRFFNVFAQAESDKDRLKAWFRGQLPDRDEMLRSLGYAIATIDKLVTDQVNELLHHSRFQKLESSWRGLDYLTRIQQELVDESERDEVPRIGVRVLNVSLSELKDDFRKAPSLDQSEIYRRVYTDGLDQPGAEPLGMIVADYEFQPWPTSSYPYDGIQLLSRLAGIAAVSFCPIVTGAGPEFFALQDSFEALGRQKLSSVFDTDREPRMIKWDAFRKSEDSRFLGLTVPRVLMRVPWSDTEGEQPTSFDFTEDVRGIDRSRYLWGNAAWPFAEVAMRAFARSGWLANVRGVTRGYDGDGLVTGLPTESFSTDRTGLAPKISVDVVVTDSQERSIAEQGFIPLCHCHDTRFSAFYSNQSAQKPKQYSDEIATMNARMSSMLQYMLCVSQFARYVKVMARDKVGSYTSAGDCEKFLHNWLVDYVTGSNAEKEERAKYPLRNAEVTVRERLGAPGVYDCEIYLQPHYELDDLSAGVRLTTELNSGRK